MTDHEHDHDHTHGHDHDHGHDHGHDDPFHVHPTKELDIDDMDPANRSLAEALRISFGLLKWLVILLVVVFLSYGSYNEIKEGEVGIKLRFGAIVGDRLDTGVHLAWPEPIEKIVVVPTGVRTVELNEAFMFSMKDAEATLNYSEKSVMTDYPKIGRDRYLLTGDRNIVHGVWKVSFRIDPSQIRKFAINVGSTDQNESLRRTHSLVRQAAERAILHVVAQTSVEDFVQSQATGSASDKKSAGQIQRLTQQMLDELNTGITVSEVSNEAYLVRPMSLQTAFKSVSAAESAKKKDIENALKDKSDIMLKAAGEGYPKLLAVIRAYQAARALDDRAGAAEAKAQLNAMLTDKASMTAHGIGGEVYRVIREAQADQTNLVRRAAADLREFEAYYAQFGDDPQLRRITMQRLWYNTLNRVFEKDHEFYRLPGGDARYYIEVGPNTEKESEEEAERRARRIGEAG